MEREYWEQFMTTGKVDDYLSYKGFSICSQVMEKYKNPATCEGRAESKGQGSESDNSYRNGAILRSYR